MRNFTLMILAMIACLSLRAQVSIGFRGGYTLSAMQFTDAAGNKSGGIGSSSQLKNLHADLLVNIPLVGGLCLQPVVRYVTKGAHLEQTVKPQGVYLPSANKIKLHYLELPVNLAYKFQLPGGKLVIGAGPYVAYSLSGTYNLDISYNGKVIQSDSRSIRFNSPDNVVFPSMRLSRWDAGANAMLAFEFNNFLTVGANYSHGLLDLDRTSGYTVKNSYIGLSVGVLLNREDY